MRSRFRDELFRLEFLALQPFLFRLVHRYARQRPAQHRRHRHGGGDRHGHDHREEVFAERTHRQPNGRDDHLGRAAGIHAASQRKRLAPGQAADFSADESAGELSDARYHDQSECHQRELRVPQDGEVGRQTGDAEEHRHEESEDKAAQLLVDVLAEDRRFADQYARDKRTQYGVHADEMGRQRHGAHDHQDGRDHGEIALEIAHRIRKKTKRRPTVKLAIRNAAVPSTLLLTLMRSMLPASARLNVIAMMIQPMESSQIAEATMICPRLRRVKPISRTIAATILMDEIESAVPRNSDVRKRWSGCGSSDSGMNWPSAKPQANGTATPVSEMLSAALPTLRTSLRSVSIPVSKSNSRMPNCEMPSSMAFCSGVLGKSACCRSGSSAPSAEGPSRIPPSNIPMIEG